MNEVNWACPKLVDALRKGLPRDFVVLRHTDKIIYGIPDISITGIKQTSHLEVKWADPEFDSPGIQELTCIRLANAGHCFYVIYGKKEKTISIVQPICLKNWREQSVVTFPEFDHDAVRKFIEDCHRSNWWPSVV